MLLQRKRHTALTAHSPYVSLIVQAYNILLINGVSYIGLLATYTHAALLRVSHTWTACVEHHGRHHTERFCAAGHVPWGL